MPSISLTSVRGGSVVVTELADLEHYLRRNWSPVTGTAQEARAAFSGLPERPAALESHDLAANKQAQAYRTTVDQTQQLAAFQPPAFESAPLGLGPVVVQPGEVLHEFFGVGAALTESSASLLLQMPVAARTALLTSLFSPDADGFSCVRISFGANDFRVGAGYTYDENGGTWGVGGTGTADPTLAAFSLNKDQQYIFPVLRQIMAINPRVRVFASVWTAPSWMLIAGAPSTFDDTNHATNLANYIVRSIQGYQAAGVPIYAVTPQNEPTGNFTRWTATQMANFIGTNLGPALDAAGLPTKIVTHDDNWNQSAFATGVLSVPAAAQYIDGVGWHGYGGNPTAQAAISRTYPTVRHYFTEYRSMLAEDFPTATDIMATKATLGSIRNGSRAVMLWNLALNETGGPLSTGSTGRRGVVTVNSSTFAVTRNPEWAQLAHIGRYVKPGARRIAANATNSLLSAAFLNPDGSVVAVIYNPAVTAQATRVVDARSGESFPVTLASRETATFVWGTPATDAPDAPVSTTPSIEGVTEQPSNGNVTGLTFYHAVPAGLPNSALVVAVTLSAGSNASPSLASVTYGGQALTRLTAVRAAPSAGTNRAVELWYLLNPPTGGRQLVATVASLAVGQDSATLNIRALNLTKVNQTAPFGTPVTAGGSAATLSATVTDAAAGDLVLDVLSVRSNAVPAATPAQAPVFASIVGTNSWGLSGRQVSTGSPVTGSYTWSTADNAALAAVAVHRA